MCGRFAATADAEDLVDFFAIDEVAGPLPAPSYNVAPTDPIAAVVERSSGGPRSLTTLRWGLVPSWAKDRRGAARLINARAETVADKPAFRRAFASRRALVPAVGYYEWYLGADGRTKQPYFLRPADGGPLVMAGLYEFWKDQDGSWLGTASVITTSATDAVGHLHDRMPLAVPRANWDEWLDPGFGRDALHLLSVPVPEFAYYPVSTAVNHVANNGASLIEPLATE